MKHVTRNMFHVTGSMLIPMFRKLTIVIVLTLVLVASSVRAATVGFVPSSGIWFSKTEIKPGESIRVYTVVVNNNYPSLSGTVTFYDNGEKIDSVEVKSLTKESVQQVRVLWEPAEGAHVVSAKLTRAVATNADGKQETLDLSSQGTVTSQTEIEIKKQGDQLVLQPETSSSDTSSGQTIAAQADDVFAKNREALDKAGDVVATLTTTAGTISRVYTGTKSAFEKGQEYYEKGEEQWQKVAPYVEKASPYWMKLSNNNEPKRVAIIVGGTILVFYVIRFFWRRRDRYEIDRY